MPYYILICPLEVCKFEIRTTSLSQSNLRRLRVIAVNHMLDKHSTSELIEGIEKQGIILPECHFSARTRIMCDGNVPANMRPVRELLSLLFDRMVKDATKFSSDHRVRNNVGVP